MTIVLEEISLNELSKVADCIHSEIEKGQRIIAFYGEMGAGKTTLIKELCRKLGVENNMNSPTFGIVNEYCTSKDDSIFHFDFYRLENEEEAYDFGYEEYFYGGDLCLIEWPQKIENLLPEKLLEVHISENNGNRTFKIVNG